MKLFYYPGACSLAPHIVLREAGFAFDLDKVDMKAKTTADGSDYLAVNPKGAVPALDLGGGEVLTEGPAITQYLADQKPESGLAPKPGTLERARLQEMLNYLSSEVHKAFGAIFGGGSDEAKKAAIETVSKRFAYLETLFADGREFVCGATFSVADAYLFVLQNWAGFVGIDLKTWPKLADYQARIAARPKVREALVAEGLAKAA
ncbi:MAG: glutathione transferase GstA [Alphaproteobacteria bacterium]|jgi:glutathione S-transferase